MRTPATEGRGGFAGEPALSGDPYSVLSRFIRQLTFQQDSLGRNDGRRREDVSRQESGLPRCRRMTPPFNLTEIPQWTTLGCPSASYRTRKNQLAQLNLAAVSGSPSQDFFRLIRFFRSRSPVPLPHGIARDGKATSRTRFDRPQDTRHDRRGPVDPHPSAVASTRYCESGQPYPCGVIGRSIRHEMK